MQGNDIKMNANSSNQQQRRTTESAPKRFPEKLMNAIDCGRYADCIQWTDDGSAFEILDPVRTEKKLLREVFNGTKMNSFVRKVYKWGFVSCTPSSSGNRKGRGVWKAFSYPLFQRGHLNLCRIMRRDTSVKPLSATTIRPLFVPGDEEEFSGSSADDDQNNNKNNNNLHTATNNSISSSQNNVVVTDSTSSLSNGPLSSSSAQSSSTVTMTATAENHMNINHVDVLELLQRIHELE